MNADTCLVDAGVFVRFYAEEDPLSEVVVSAMGKLSAAGTRFFFTPQVVRESWSVLTRPVNVGGYGLEPDVAANAVSRAHEGLIFLQDSPEVYSLWLEIVLKHEIRGRQVHDAYHVAAMRAHGLACVLTLNDRDFKRYEGISVLRPQSV